MKINLDVSSMSDVIQDSNHTVHDNIEEKILNPAIPTNLEYPEAT